MTKVHHAIYLTIIGALTITIVGLLTPQSIDRSDQVASYGVVVFSFHSMDSDSESVATELTAALTRSLKNVPNINIVSESDLPSSMKNPSDHHLWPKSELVSLILEGTVQSSDDGVRITAQLIDASTDAHVWSNSFVLEQDSIAAIVAAVENQVIVTASR